MSAKVTITVELGQGHVVLTHSQDASGDNPLYDAAELEQAITRLSRKALAQIAALHGDIRRSPTAPRSAHEYECPITGGTP